MDARKVRLPKHTTFTFHGQKTHKKIRKNNIKTYASLMMPQCAAYFGVVYKIIEIETLNGNDRFVYFWIDIFYRIEYSCVLFIAIVMRLLRHF